MSATMCLGAFATKLRALPWAQWRGLIDTLPTVCPNGCRVNCRDVCAEYARMQYRMAKARQVTQQHKGAKR